MEVWPPETAQAACRHDDAELAWAVQEVLTVVPVQSIDEAAQDTNRNPRELLRVLQQRVRPAERRLHHQKRRHRRVARRDRVPHRRTHRQGHLRSGRQVQIRWAATSEWPSRCSKTSGCTGTKARSKCESCTCSTRSTTWTTTTSCRCRTTSCSGNTSALSSSCSRVRSTTSSRRTTSPGCRWTCLDCWSVRCSSRWRWQSGPDWSTATWSQKTFCCARRSRRRWR